MEKIVRNVADIETADRRALEHVIGKSLADHQQIIITVVNVEVSPADTSGDANPGAVPPWWNVYEGLSEEEIDRLDQAVRQRANLTRVFE